MTLNQLSLKIAQSQNGVQEVPRNSNAGAAVESYLKSVGLGKGYSWCMAFVYWSVKEAAKQLNSDYGLNRNKETIGITSAPIDFVKSSMYASITS